MVVMPVDVYNDKFQVSEFVCYLVGLQTHKQINRKTKNNGKIQ